MTTYYNIQKIEVMHQLALCALYTEPKITKSQWTNLITLAVPSPKLVTIVADVNCRIAKTIRRLPCIVWEHHGISSGTKLKAYKLLYLPFFSEFFHMT